jgi:hypothetical protein
VFRLILLLGAISALIIPTAYAVEPLDRLQVTSPRLEDFAGNTIGQSIIVNQLVLITADITNSQDVPQDFVYIIQIKDSQGIIRYLSSFSAEIDSGKTFSPALSWTPNTAGRFVAEIYVWESFTNPDALSESLSLSITAS